MLLLWQNFHARQATSFLLLHEAIAWKYLFFVRRKARPSPVQKLQAKVEHGESRDFAKLAPQGRYGLLRFLCVALFEQRLDDTDFARCLVYGSRDLEEGAIFSR